MDGEWDERKHQNRKMGKSEEGRRKQLGKQNRGTRKKEKEDGECDGESEGKKLGNENEEGWTENGRGRKCERGGGGRDGRGSMGREGGRGRTKWIKSRKRKKKEADIGGGSRSTGDPHGRQEEKGKKMLENLEHNLKDSDNSTVTVYLIWSRDNCPLTGGPMWILLSKHGWVRYHS